ncbi:MAG: hypothetical protein HKM04_09325 [Legionellales bacterium]|nr:hypothetical protein [Legionellales bacterium]
MDGFVLCSTAKSFLRTAILSYSCQCVSPIIHIAIEKGFDFRTTNSNHQTVADTFTVSDGESWVNHCRLGYITPLLMAATTHSQEVVIATLIENFLMSQTNDLPKGLAELKDAINALKSTPIHLRSPGAVDRKIEVIKLAIDIATSHNGKLLKRFNKKETNLIYEAFMRLASLNDQSVEDINAAIDTFLGKKVPILLLTDTSSAVNQNNNNNNNNNNQVNDSIVFFPSSPDSNIIFPEQLLEKAITNAALIVSTKYGFDLANFGKKGNISLREDGGAVVTVKAPQKLHEEMIKALQSTPEYQILKQSYKRQFEGAALHSGYFRISFIPEQMPLQTKSSSSARNFDIK